MGVIRWAGKGLELIGRILTMEDVEAWLENEGKGLVKKRLEALAVKWLFGKRRAKSKAFSDISENVNSSEPLRLALKRSLEKLPPLIGALADHIKTKGPKQLLESNFPLGVVVVPRALVQNEYELILLTDLAEAAELSRFSGLPQLFLKDEAKKSEFAFFEMMKRGEIYTLPDRKTVLLDVDPDFDWHLTRSKGHYYCGHSDRFNVDLTHRGERKEFLEEIQTLLNQRKTKIGYFTPEEIETIAAEFRTK
jgi:hypothetical protein